MRLIPLSLMAILAGCATTTITPPTQRVGSQPQVGVLSTAPVGAEMYTRFNYLARTGAYLTTDARFGAGPGSVSVSVGEPLIEVVSDDQILFCTQRNAYIDLIVGPHRPACFLDANNDGQFERSRVIPGAIPFWTDLPGGLPYKKGEMMVSGAGSYKQELLYQGSSRSTLKLAYREYTDNLARPAFFQDLTYELEPLPMTITFRTTRIEVSSADNNQITYKVLAE